MPERAQTFAHKPERCNRPGLEYFAALFAMFCAFAFSPLPAHAKIPGTTHCYNGICHRVKTISETEKLIGTKAVLQASHYDRCGHDRFNPCGLTSSGERFAPDRSDNAASPIYPDGTKLLVWHPENKRAAVVRVNNAGPYYGRRTLDLSRGAADKLGFSKRGVATLHVKVLSAPTSQEARYRKERRYPPVAGYIGAFESIETALLGVGLAVASVVAAPVRALAQFEPTSAASTGGKPKASSAPAKKIASKRPAKRRAYAAATAAKKKPPRFASAGVQKPARPPAAASMGRNKETRLGHQNPGAPSPSPARPL